MADITERVAKLETRVDEHDKKLNDLDKITESMIEMACGIKNISNEITDLKVDNKEIKEKINNLEDRPGNWSLKGIIWALGIIGAAILGYVINILLN